MSKFNSLLESNLKSTDLLRIRVKFDPANESDIRKEYVGYVLEEDDSGVIAIVPDLGPDSMSLTPDQFERDVPQLGSCDGDPLSRFKKHLVEFLMVRGYHDKVSDYMEHIINATNPIDLEKVIKGCGCDETIILDLYRDFVSDAQL